RALLSRDARRGHLPAAVAGRGVLLLQRAHRRRRRRDDGRRAPQTRRQRLPLPASSPSRSSYLAGLFFGCAILVVSSGVRSSFGLFLPEMTQARGCSRETFSLAIALQNLMWGLGGSFLGAMADKYGAMRTLLLGGVLYVVGFLGMAWAEGGAGLSLSAGVVMGVAIGGTSFGVVLATLGRVVPAEQRSLAFGIGVAAGSFGPLLFLQIAGQLIQRI